MREEIRDTILSWKGVVEKPNKYGNISFFVNGKEFSHFHSDTQMDIKKPIGFGLKGKRIESNPFSNSWLHFNFKVKKDIEDMMKIVRKIYEELYESTTQRKA